MCPLCRRIGNCLIPAVPKQIAQEINTKKNNQLLKDWVEISFPSFHFEQSDPKHQELISTLKEFSLRIKGIVLNIYLFF
jgi:hypothetical protein